MNLVINGEEKSFLDNVNLQEIITSLQIEDKVMAAAVNMEIVKKDEWAKYVPKSDDKVELLQFVGGGWLSRQKGNLAEEKACVFLKQEGFFIIEQNFYAKKLGEIDIIASKDEVYHFIEVKSALSYEIAVNNISTSKLSKLKNSINFYLQKNKLDVSYTLDAIIVINEEIEFLENISM